MTDPEEGEHSGALRVVLDANVFVAAAIGGTGPPARLLQLAADGRITLVVSPALLGEVRDVLLRDKMRRWMSIDDAGAYVQAILLLGEVVNDPPPAPLSESPCRDADDEYLLDLVAAERAAFLVSGDHDLLTLHRPGVEVRTPRAAVEAAQFRHEWGSSVIPATDEEAPWRQAVAEGNDAVLGMASAFFVMLDQDDASIESVLPYVVTPESLPLWRGQLNAVREMVQHRGMTSRPQYPAPDIAYVRLPPDPGVTLRATEEILLPRETIIMTLRRRPDLEHPPGTGGWRVHQLGRPAELELIP